MAASPLR
jgi:hypothetical protein